MADSIKIPMFPLAIFPLPGELVPLHIFEPRYRQLLADIELHDFLFGIYCNHTINTDKLGSLVKLESVIKRHPNGESDIIVKSLDLFKLNTLYRTFKDKLYPGGEVELWNVNLNESISEVLKENYEKLRLLMSLKTQNDMISHYQMAGEINLDLNDRLKFVGLDRVKKESFLLSRVKYEMRLLHEAEKAKDIFHLN